MPRVRKVGRWGLRARLLVPVVGLAVLTAVVLGVIGDLSARKQAQTLVERRGAAVLEDIANRVEERQQSKEVYARLLASDADLIPALEKGDKVALAQVLVPLKAELDLGFVDVYAEDGRELLSLGENEEHLRSSLTPQALTGLTQSSVEVGEKGLQVSAAVPVKGPEGTVGAVVVGTVLGGDTLEEVKGQDDVELAVYQDGELVATSTDQPDLARLLGEHEIETEDLGALNRDLESFDFEATTRLLESGDQILALVSTRDLELASSQRNLMVLVSFLLLMSVLLVVLLLQGRNIAQPLTNIIAATGDMVRGNYDRRVTSSKIRELDDLGQAVNHLAQQLKVQLATLEHQAFHDSLTDLPNRALMMDRLGHALARKERHGNLVGLLFIDLDNFKVINDSLGHHTGDELLVAVARRLQECARNEDTVARLGGDEFTLLLEDLGDAADAGRVAGRIMEELKAPFVLDGQEVFTTASIGIALSAAEHHLPEDLLRNADTALYKAKNEGKGGHAVFDASMYSRAWERLRMESELRQAIADGQLRLYYQPKVLLAENPGQIFGFEALVRWEHPERGLVSPAEFIPVAEETGLIVPIGQWVLEEACRQAKEWQERHPSDAPLTMSVNLSGRQVERSVLARNVDRVLRETGLDARSLSLEITESIMMKDVESTIGTFRELKALGVKLEVDDFGTGYSSLSYLKRFPVDCLKIDRSFVDRLGEEAGDTAIVRATVSLAHALGLGVIAEGVETDEQVAHLRDLGCELGQGYHFSKPLPAARISEMLAERSPVL